jgi:hypothetical protein
LANLLICHKLKHKDKIMTEEKKQQIVSRVDHTLLKAVATWEQVDVRETCAGYRTAGK